MMKNEKMKTARNAVIRRINRVCEQPWSEDDLREGKNIIFPWKYYKAALSVVNLYTEKGWVVQHSVVISSEGRKMTLNVRKPKEYW